ncbi:bacterio-opsin activator [Natronococcus pandeyae]|uniref:Bacterio-opsin activator n=1 Tax=Natronococcus pandeyae TaxID=2055836 RepID=A0A8J8Q3I7_9EURY|nr:helix-turn-helix domain-containing protein [Natronococcus pandeyae]TYL39515.1 bacterio-opsin activator [Natronococcus pandeyae]
MGFVLEARLSHQDLVLMPTIEAVSGVTVRYEYTVSAAEDTSLFVSVFGSEYEAVEQAMEADHTVSNPNRIVTFPNRAIYRVTMESALDPIPPRCAEEGLFVFKITSDKQGWIVRIYLPDRGALVTFRESCQEREISFRVRQLQESNSNDDATYFLTEQQHEILLLAYYAGYYDIPRRVSQGDLADQLGISTSAVSQRLRRAVAELVSATLETNRTPEAIK